MLLNKVRKALRAASEPDRAPAMQAYMKSAMPYHGVSAPRLREVCRAVYADLAFDSAAHWRAAVLELWRGARYREERYAAMNLAGDKRASAFQTPAVLALYEEMIVTGAWWDYVDDIAAHRIGTLLRNHPAPLRRAMRAWSRCPDLWKRRSAIISQLGFKADTDLELLYACIEPSLDSPEFFLRKAIGWALRQHAWTDPQAVQEYVARNRDRLSPLSVREALKNVSKPGFRPRGSRA
jgi:3-methyladenine DNA glycosylase AlkD